MLVHIGCYIALLVYLRFSAVVGAVWCCPCGVWTTYDYSTPYAAILYSDTLDLSQRSVLFPSFITRPRTCQVQTTASMTLFKYNISSHFRCVNAPNYHAILDHQKQDSMPEYLNTRLEDLNRDRERETCTIWVIFDIFWCLYGISRCWDSCWIYFNPLFCVATNTCTTYQLRIK